MHYCLYLLMVTQMATPRSWLGVQPELVPGPIAASGRSFTQALRLTGVVAGGPAARAGLRANDLLVACTGVNFTTPPAKLVQHFVDVIGQTPPGTRVAISIIRDQVLHEARLDGQLLSSPRLTTAEALLRSQPPGARYEMKATRQLVLRELPITLEPRGSRQTATHPLPADAQVFSRSFPVTPAEKLARRLLLQRGLSQHAGELLLHLSNLQQTGDVWRLPRPAYIHRHPFDEAGVASALFADVEGATALTARLTASCLWLDRPAAPVRLPRLARAGCTIETRVAEIVDALHVAKVHYDKAFRQLSDAEMGFLLGQLNTMGRELSRAIYLEDALTPLRADANLKVVQLAEKIDYTELFAAARVLSSFVEQAAGDFRKDLERGYKGAIRRETAVGPILIAGPERNTHEADAAVLIDLGGDDSYTAHAATSAGRGLPFSIVIDYSGDDAYETSVDWAQGCGRLGIGILADFGGNDSYVAQHWAQGAAALGVGMLYDSTGEDNYRAWDFVQGAAFAGIALLADGAGRDSYSATRFAQACALPGGFGHLFDGAGDDSYYSKGNHRTNYGDTGTFDSWSQGCAMGFRGVASGGIALLSDRSGNDRYEAGNFSQGGGYYHGWGLLHDARGDDWYMGSRYAQGFAAHQAAGYFQDDAGNDRYGTRLGVAQGMAWDECVVTFVDASGNDTYSGGQFGSVGAAAHNGFTLFLDLSGNDTYDFGQGPARAGPNDYHGGTSLAITIDAGGGVDRYTSGFPNNAVTPTGQDGFLIDMSGALQ